MRKDWSTLRNSSTMIFPRIGNICTVLQWYPMTGYTNLKPASMSITGSSVQRCQNTINRRYLGVIDLCSFTNSLLFLFVVLPLRLYSIPARPTHSNIFQHSKPSLQHIPTYSNPALFHRGCFFTVHICQGNRGETSLSNTFSRWSLWILSRARI